MRYMIDKERFTVRVYGIVINASGNVLLTDELRYGVKMTKFPGGGLQYGEGVVDCLKREFMEELGQEPHNLHHFYTTEFFQSTALIDPPKQLISIYYTADILKPGEVPVASRIFDFEEKEGAQTFRWVSLSELHPNAVTYPIDKIVVQRLLDDHPIPPSLYGSSSAP